MRNRLGRSDVAPFPAFMEALEPRLMLNGTPVLDVPDIAMSYNLAHQHVTLTDDANVTYAVVDGTVKAAGQTAFELKTQLGLATYAPQWDGWGGSKWLQTAGGAWYAIFSDGRVTSWQTGQLAGTVIPAYYTNPTLLIDAVATPLPDGTVTVAAHNVLTITPHGFLGIFSATLRATEGDVTVDDTFSVTVTNSPPVLDVPDVAMPYNQANKVLTLLAADADNDHVTYEVVAINGPGQAAYELKTQLGLTTYAPQYDGWGGAKWLQGAGGAWYAIFSDGRVTSWWTGQLEGTLDTSYYTDPNTLVNADPDHPMPGSTVTVAGNLVTITPPDDFLGIFSVTLSATDGAVSLNTAEGASTVTDTFSVTVANSPPVLDVADFTMSDNAAHWNLVLPATDADGDHVTYEVGAVSGPGQAAFELKTQLGLTTYAPQYDGCCGSKWLQGGGARALVDGVLGDQSFVARQIELQWYQIFSDGRVTSWWTGQLEGTVDTSYYTDPNTLIDADADPMPDGTVTVAGNLLTITPPTDFLGIFSVTLSATDGAVGLNTAEGASTVTDTFSVTVADSPPVIDIDNVVMSQNIVQNQAPPELGGNHQGLHFQNLTLPATDADGDHVTYLVLAVNGPGQAAFELKTQLGLTTYAPQYDGWGGSKWLQGAGGAWYAICSNGRVTSWWTGQLEGTLDTSYYTDPNTLVNADADPMPDGTVTVAGNVLTITPPAGFLGTFSTTLSATDNAVTLLNLIYGDHASAVTGSFTTTVTVNAPPVLDTDDVITMPHDTHRDLVLPATDADGTAVTYAVVAVNGPGQAAYELKQQLGLTTYAPQYDGCCGSKWLQTAGGAWYQIFSNGRVTSWWTGQLEGTVDPSYYTDPNTLIDADEDAMPDGTVTVAGNLLTITPPTDFLGNFSVTLSATDGLSTVTDTFTVAVVDAVAPTVAITPVAPDPRSIAVASVGIVFSESVAGFDLADLSLTCDGDPVSLAGATLTSADNMLWTLGNLTGVTGTVGTYILTLNASDAEITDAVGRELPLTTGASDTWTMHTTAPTVAITPIDPDPRNTAIASATIVFSEAVTGFDLTDLALTRDTVGVTLAGPTQTLTSTDNITWTLNGLTGLTATAGTYVLTLTAAGSGITDAAANALVVGSTDAWVVHTTAPTVAITAITPDPRNTAIASATIVFSEAVTGFDLTDLALTRDTVGVTLAGPTQTLTTSNNITWTLNGLTDLTDEDGTYVLTLTAAGSGITDAAANALTVGSTDAWVMIEG